MKTKLLKTAIMAGLLGAFIYGSANAATFENLTYEVADGNVTITGHVEDVSGELVIPETIDGKTVIAIKENAFENCAEITEVQIPDTVKTIGVCAFFNCEKLEKIDISSNMIVSHFTIALELGAFLLILTNPLYVALPPFLAILLEIILLEVLLPI